MSDWTARALGATCLAAAIALSSGAAYPPRPEAIIGFPACADYRLATYEQALDYFKVLDAATERLRLFDIGPTAGGRPQALAAISSEDNLRRLDRWKEISSRLALARDLNDEQARSLAAEGRAVVWIDFGLHSTEVAPAQAAPELAWRLVSREDDETARIRDQVIFLLLPNLNPDGTTLVADWYTRHVGTPFERSPPPELYHLYAGHDNNRDWFMFNLPESRNVARQLYHEWFPQIVYNQHQTAPFPARIFVPPFRDPMNPNIPPLVVRGVNLVGDAISRRLDREGRPGAVSRMAFDMWWNGGMRTAPYYHNMVGILTETAHASASPATYDPSAFPAAFADGTPTMTPSTVYPSPYRGGYWRLADSCEYLMSASLAVLDIAARRRPEWLYDIYQMARDAIRAGAGETYVVPAGQRDPGTAVRMINVLRLGGVDVHQAYEPFRAGGRAFEAGTFIIRGAQPFRPYLTDLLNPQVYPERRPSPGGPPERPYDITGWTLPFQMGVETVRLDEDVGGRFTRVERAASPPGQIAGSASFAWAIDARSNDAVTAVTRLLAAGETVLRATQPVPVGGTDWPPGTFLVPSGPQTRDRLERDVAMLGLDAPGVDSAPHGELLRVRQPRVGLYRPWGGNIDEGWTRWLFEQFEFPYETVRDRDIRTERLGERYDVIVLPDASYQDLLNGRPTGSMPEEFAGGMTPTGVANLYEFVSGGGTLVTLDTAAELPLTAFGLPVRNAAAGQADLDIPGSLLRITLDPTHPVAYGMPEEAAAFFAHSPVFDVRREPLRPDLGTGDEPKVPEDLQVVARYPTSDLLMSGWLLGEPILAGRAAVIEAAVGRGRVVLLGFRVQHRGQSHGTFKLLFNALLLGGYERAAP